MFHNRSIEDYGIPLQGQKIVPGNTATAISSGAFQYAHRTLAFTAGGTTVPVVGDILVGATSAATATITAISALTGATAWANSDAAGSFTIKNQIGTFGAGEKLKIGADADIATATANSVAVATDYRFKNCLAKVAVIQVLAQTALIAIDGSTPDQTALIGWSVPAGGQFVVLEEAIQRIKIIDRVASSASTVYIQCYF